MTRQVYEWLRAHPLLNAVDVTKPSASAQLIFPFWNGDDEDLAKATNRLSQAFRRGFAGSPTRSART